VQDDAVEAFFAARERLSASDAQAGYDYRLSLAILSYETTGSEKWGRYFAESSCRRKQRRNFLRYARHCEKETMGAGQGLVLVFGVAALVGLVWILVYSTWYLPMQKAMQ
jgi:hypothetical protein